MISTADANIRSLSTEKLAQNASSDPSAFAPEELFVMHDELVRRDAMSTNLPVQLEQLVEKLTNDQLEAIERNENDFSDRSIHSSIIVKLSKGLATLSWFYGENGQQHGPVNRNQLFEYAKSGKIKAKSLVWREGMQDWVSADQIRGLIPPLEQRQETSPNSPSQQERAPSHPPRSPYQQQQTQYGSPQQQAQYRNPYPGYQVPKRRISGLLIAAAVIQFLAVPVWFLVGFGQMFEHRLDDDFLLFSLFFLMISGLFGIVKGIGYLLVKKWSFWMKMITGGMMVIFLVYRASIARYDEEVWIGLLVFELIILGLVSICYKKFYENT